MSAPMRFSATRQSLLALPTRTRREREKQPTPFSLRVRQGFLALLFALVPVVASAQVGREFVAVEAYVGRARVVHVGKILEIKQIEYGKPLTDIQKLGKPYRLVFKVSETIRGDEVKSLELVLSLQSTHFLEYMRDHSIEIMLVGGPTRGDSYRGAEIGIEEQGKRVDDERYQFRLLDNVKVPESGGKDSIAAQINQKYDSCRMFTNELEIVVGREAILKRARDFAKQHSDVLSAVSLRVPNEFGALCGDPNAFCTITLPICPETKPALVALKDDPGLILRRIKSRDEDVNLSLLLVGAHKALAMFTDVSPPAVQWVDSDDEKLALRLSSTQTVTDGASIRITVQIRNTGKAPITLLRPFGDWYDAKARGIKIWDNKRQIPYSGPTGDYDVRSDGFAIVAPGATIEDHIDLTMQDFAGIEAPGTYSFRYDYSYNGVWDKTAAVGKNGVRDAWRGNICSREVQVTRR